MAGTFHPPPPQFVGGNQPYAPHQGIVTLIGQATAPGTAQTARQQLQAQIVLSWFTPPPPPFQPPPIRLIAHQAISVNTAPLGGNWSQQPANIAATQAWQPPFPPPQQRLPNALLNPQPKLVIVIPPPPAPGPRIVFPHDDEGWNFWGNTARQEATERLRRARIDIGLLPPDEEPTEAEEVREQINAGLSVDEIAQRLSAHFYAKYQTALQQAQAKADLERETQRRRQDYLLSSSERAQRIETGKRLALRKAIEEDDAKVMALLNDLL